VVVFVPLKVKSDAPPGPIKLEVKLQYQMCDDKACYAPQRPTIATETKVVPANTSIELNRPELFAAAVGQTAVVSNSGKTDKTEWTVWTAFGAALLAGLLFNVMPCVLPVLPLKAAAFHRAAEHHRSRSILLGTAFSIGIIAVFAVLAVLVLVLRVISWGSLFSNPWFVWSLVVLLVICGFGMFGAINITLPTALYNVDPRQDTFGGNVIFGAFTAILATPCTAPLLPPLLLWATSQPVLIGVPAMLLVGVGMALPYLILSAFPEAAKKFPRTGPWAELFKQMMGFLLLASATYFAAGRLIHGPGFWWMVVAVAAIAALFLIARTVQLTDAARPVGIAATLSVALVALPLAWTLRVTAETPFQPYTDQQFAQLRTAGKPILVKFTANWCGTCQYIEGTVFTDARVLQALKQRDVTPLKVDFSDNDDAPGKQLLLKLNPAGGIPLTAIFAPGKTDPVVLSSVYSSSELLEALDAATGPVQTAAK
jgi:suppressor for copper-sensitivity B